jgi:hypothetical protein
MRCSPGRETNGLNHCTRFGGGAGIPLEEVGDRCFSEECVDAPGDFLPAVVRGAWVGVAAGGAANETPWFADRLERRHDTSEGEALGARGEAESAAGPALGPKHAGAGEEVEGFGKVVARAPHHGNDFVDANRSFVSASGDAQNSVNGLLRGAGQPHRPDLPTNCC